MDFVSPPTADRTADRTVDRQLYLATDERERGSTGPFYPAYTDADRSERYGYVCGRCDSTAVEMDPMGRLECSDCGNTRKPTKRDAAYL